MLLWLSIALAGPAPRPTAFVDVNVLPMGGGAARAGQVVLVHEGRIVALGPVAEVAVPVDAVRVEAAGRWLVPGLVDSHVHLHDPADLVGFLCQGVTTVVNMAGTPEHLVWKRAVEAGDLPGPHVLTTGPMVDLVDDPIFGALEAVGSEAEAEAVVGRHAAAGYDFVKVHGDLEVGLYDAVVRAAKDRGLKVIGHLSERVGLLHSMKVRQDSIEHTDELIHAFFNDQLDEARIPVAVDAIVRGGAVVTPTLVSIARLEGQLARYDELAAATEGAFDGPLVRAYWARPVNPYLNRYGPEERRFFERSLRFQGQIVGALHAAGVPVLAGTDAGWVPFVPIGVSLRDELALLADAGLGSRGALEAATSAPGAFYGTGAGVVQIGAVADLVLLDGDPIADRAALGRVEGVMVGGVWRDRAALDRLRDAREAAQVDSRPIADALAGGDVDGAVALARVAIRRGSVDAAEARWLALVLYRLGRVDACVDVLGWAAEANPGSWSAHRTYGRALLAIGRRDAARIELQRALDAAPAAAIAPLEQDLRRAG